MILPPLYAILDTDVTAAHGWSVADLAEACLAGGARVLQIRAKRVPSGPFLTVVDAVVAAAAPWGALVIVNDRADVARLAGAGGVHVGQEDPAPSDVRSVVGPTAVVGLSTHTRALVERAVTEPISYVAVGPVFPTATKDTGCDPVGLALVTEAFRIAGAGAPSAGDPMPVVAIGGITLASAPSVIEAGATSVAVVSDLFATGDPEARTRELVRRLADVQPRAVLHG